MADERWKEISRIYADAAALEPAARDAYLRERCGGDESLVAEIRSLLLEDSRAERLFDPKESPVALIGRRIGVYEITALLGAGGMGEVYRARDTKLGRDVAIKVLPGELTDDKPRLARFRREARLLATLNHPNIGAIYGTEEADGVHALVLELVDGPTLDERIAERRLTIEESLRIARDIAAALSAAHAKGIVHRDLKPENIKLTHEGNVKLLDFGLAKAGQLGGGELLPLPAVTIDGTEAGVILGTAAYMSPEQARARPVDARTDIWAFGCVLYEMLTGQPAFGGETLSDTIARVISSEPAWKALPRSTPAAIRALLKGCLEKDGDKRIADSAAVRREVDAALAFSNIESFAIFRSRRLTVPPGIAVGSAFVAIAAAAAVAVMLRAREVGLPQLTNPIQVTRALGVEDHPTWSPDGATVAYESNESGNWDISVSSVSGGRSINRTADHSGADLYPSWSPDGRQIAFWSSRDGGGYYVMSALGGPAARLVATPGRDLYFHSAPEWSADGTELAAVAYTLDPSRDQPTAQIVSLATRDARVVELPGTQETRLDLAWSPNGRFFAYVEAAQQQSEVTQLRVSRLGDARASTLTDGRTNVRRPRWSPDSRFLFYIANREGAPDLWRQAIADDGRAIGQPRRVTAGLEMRDAAFSRDGRRMVFSKGRWVSNVWRVPILEDRPATWGDATQVTFDQAFVEFFDVSADGQRLLYSSDRAGNQDLWMMPMGGDPLQLTFDPAPDWAPDWSPDEREIAFYSARTGDREIWKMPAAGGPATQLTRSPGLDAGTQWSPNGHEIAFRSERTGNSEVWIVSADGRESRQVTNHPAGEGLSSWSPDGHWLAFSSNRSGRNQIWRVRATGGEPELLLKGSGFAPHWASNGHHIYFNGYDDRAGNIWRLSLDDRRERPMTKLVGKRGEPGRMPPDSDGKFLYFTWREDLGDIWVMDMKQER